jgi:hypothetical protein
MKKVLRFRFVFCVPAITSILLGVLSLPATAYTLQGIDLTQAEPEKLILPAGTPIVISFDSAITPLTHSLGQRVSLRVAEPVKVDGKTVIEAGAVVVAEISRSQKKGAVGKPAVIGISLLSVTTVDGSSIAISGQKVVEGENKQTTSLVVTIICCVLGLIMKGGDAEIPAGTQVNAATITNAEIAV